MKAIEINRPAKHLFCWVIFYLMHANTLNVKECLK